MGYACTVGQVVLDLRTVPFAHAQVYVPLSRARTSQQALILASRDVCHKKKITGLAYSDLLGVANQ
jgi:hypothetical protein